MADIAHKKTDKTIEELAERFNEIYEQADNDLNDKLIAFYEKFAKDDAEMLAKLEAGEITKKRYTEWRYTKMLTGERYFDLRDELAQDLVNVNSNARAMIAGEMADVYALNRNYAVYQVENSAHLKTSYVIYNKQAVENLLANDELRLPYPRTESPTAKLLRERIDLQWNRQKVNSALAQGILQGEPITKIAERLMTVTNMNHSAAIRNARTMMTATQNQARVDSYDELRDEGVELDEYWVATLDAFTRHSHRLLHGEMKDRETHTYSNGLEYPADPFGKPAEVYNCRCSEVAYPKGMKFEVPKSSPKLEEDFEIWQQGGTGHAILGETREQPVQTANVPVRKATPESWATRELNGLGVKRIEVQPYAQQPTPEDIIKRISGGDLTEGSCASLSLCYAGNQAGYKCDDFRDGNSREFFSSKYNKREMYGDLGITVTTARSLYQGTGSLQLLKQMEVGHEYILEAGAHSSVVRRLEDGTVQYLELQSSRQNGWKRLGYIGDKWGQQEIKENMNWRFGYMNSKFYYAPIMIDVDEFKNNDAFVTVLDYINTEEGEQHKGAMGHER